ncbi:hypothetical protein ABYF32_01690 [Buchananella felis]|uniref:hypothetical protein n=1 Tax=Buchananella felis TaxID=3231492 RepID=UPI003528B21B
MGEVRDVCGGRASTCIEVYAMSPALGQVYAEAASRFLNLRWYGLHSSGSEFGFKKARVVTNIVAILAAPLLQMALPLVSNSGFSWSGHEVLWAWYMSALSLFVIGAELGIISIFKTVIPYLDDVLTDTGRRRFGAWVFGVTGFWRQLSWSVGCVIFALGGLYVSLGRNSEGVLVGLNAVSYLSAGVVAFHLANGVWVTITGSLLVVVLASRECMSLNPYFPASTPAIERLVVAYRYSFFGACLGVYFALKPIVVLFQLRKGAAESLTILVILSCLALLSLVLVAILPDWCLTSLIRDERHDLLRQLQSRVSESGALGARGREVEHELSWMSLLVNGKRTTFSLDLIVKFVAAIAGSLLPLLISYLLEK